MTFSGSYVTLFTVCVEVNLAEAVICALQSPRSQSVNQTVCPISETRPLVDCLSEFLQVLLIRQRGS